MHAHFLVISLVRWVQFAHDVAPPITLSLTSAALKDIELLTGPITVSC